MKKTLLFLATSVLFVFSSCSKDDDPGVACLADQLTLTETEVNDLSSQNAVIVTFDAKNTSSQEYDIQKGSRPIYVKVNVTTADGSKYQTEQILTIQALSPGATASTEVLANYGANKAFQSYTIETKYCK